MGRYRDHNLKQLWERLQYEKNGVIKCFRKNPKNHQENTSPNENNTLRPAFQIPVQISPMRDVTASCSKISSRTGNPASSGYPPIDRSDASNAREVRGWLRAMPRTL